MINAACCAEENGKQVVRIRPSANTLFDRMDSDQDGSLTRDEFKKWAGEETDELLKLAGARFFFPGVPA